MSVFRRRSRHEAEPAADDTEHEAPDLPVQAAAEAAVESIDEEPPPVEHPQGPWDVEDLPDDDQVRLDLGSIRLPGFEGMEIQVNVAEGGGEVTAVTAVAGDAALQVQPFAAPRREGIWAEVRAELLAQITADGGSATEVEGPFGPELHAQVPVAAPPGQPEPSPGHGQALVPARFLGVDGPRWFLRGVLTGRAAVDADAAGPLEGVFRGTVVVRGGEPRAPRDPLPLRLPDSAPAPAPEPAPARPPLDLGTGQYITEIH